MKKTSRKKKTAAAQGSKQASGSRAKSKQTVAKKAGAKSAKKGGPANDRTHLPLPADANWLDEVYARRRPCTDFTVAEAGQQVAVTGWAFRYRDQGGCVFVDLRDRSGLIQAVFDLSVLGDRFGEAERIRHEFVIAVEGKLRSRTPENINPKLKTGDIEILVQRFEILSKAETPPITLEEHVEVHEDTRLKYRYLDMRRMHMFYALQSRSRLNQALRSGLEAQGFIEVETPVLNKSTPEGARDFLVPARQSPGAFYALPQSPQLFKQLLMMGGVERYFQIVKCFRDEDFRADRQPEFTQLDLEMSFVNEEIVMHTMERLWAGALESTFNIQVSLPVSRLSYRDAMELYGKDAPDLRYDMKLVDVADIAAESDFKVFKEIAKGSGRVKVLPVPGGAKLSRKDIDDLTAWVGEHYGAKGLGWMKHEEGGLKSVITKFFNEGQLNELARRCGTQNGDILFFGAGEEHVVHASLGALRVKLANDLKMIPDNVWKFVWIVDFPLFERDPKTGQLYSMHHPFTAPHPEDAHILEDATRFQKEGHTIRARAYDLVLNGTEIGGGSIRIHDMEMQSRVFAALGIGPEEAEAKFGFFLEALKYGTPPHGGIAFGMDRILMHFLKRDSIRDVIAFPKTQKGHCLLSDSPATVTPEQLAELRLRVVSG